jgi:hypothetical protein
MKFGGLFLRSPVLQGIRCVHLNLSFIDTTNTHFHWIHFGSLQDLGAMGPTPGNSWKDGKTERRSLFKSGLRQSYTISYPFCGNDLLDQFEALQPAPMLLGFQTKFEDHGPGCVTVEEAVLLR